MWRLLKELWHSEFMSAFWSGLVAGSIGVLMITCFFFFMDKKEKEAGSTPSPVGTEPQTKAGVVTTTPSPEAKDIFAAALRRIRSSRPVERSSLRPREPAPEGLLAIEPGGDHELSHEFRRQMWANYSWRLAVVGLLFHVEQEEAKKYTGFAHDSGQIELAAALTEALRQGLVGVGLHENLMKPMKAYYAEDDVEAIKKISRYTRTRGRITIYKLLQEQPNALPW